VPRVGQELFYMPTNFAEIGGTLRSLANSGGKFGLNTLATGRVFATSIAEYVPTRLTLGRLALLGDAAQIVVPATGAGLRTSSIQSPPVFRN
jgi:hypothetical protein